MTCMFPETEFRRRAQRLQQEMRQTCLDAVLLTGAHDIFYLSGFLTRFWESPTRPWYVVLPQSGDPVAVIPAIGADLMHQSWLTDIRTWQSPDPRDDGVSLLADALCAMIPPSGRLGVAMGPETQLRMPLADYARLTERIAPRSVADATAVLHRVREIKSEAEIDRIRMTCTIAGRAFARVPEFARPGLPLAELFRRFQMTLLEEGADWVSYLAGGAGAGGYGDVISPASNHQLTAGDVLMLDTGAVCQGYFCDFDRNWAIGAATEDTRRAHSILVEATEEVIGGLRPGGTASDLHAKIVAELTRREATPLAGRLGHGVGIALTEWPSLSPLDHRPLREGMVLAIEPGIEIAPGRIMVHEENVVLRASGAECLSPAISTDIPVLT
ncbi:M24 family metallopeptidase [Pseudooceanicola sp. C21-150M6]|uniref:M24 family metallopeptidase n=1 Tax=Pseudooceanicola sp. C21-150M6 TaxID=3434355 RepID=UPI003D7F40DF